MFEYKHLITFTLFISSILSSDVLEVSNGLGCLKVMPNANCKGNIKKITETEVAKTETLVTDDYVEKTSKVLVEVVKYKLIYNNGDASFPVSVRSNSLQGDY